MSARTLTIASISCLVLFALLMHWPIFLQGKTVSAFDLSYSFMDAYKPVRPAGLERPSNGLLSDPVVQFNVWDKAMFEGPLTRPWLWNPYAGCGSPLLANAQAAPFSPLKALAYTPAGVARGFGLLCFLKMLLAGLLMYAYMRAVGAGPLNSCLGGISFMACGFMVVWLQWPHTHVAAMLPALFLGCERMLQRRLKAGVLLVALATALGLLGGHPETSFHITVAAAFYLAARVAFRLLDPDREKRPPVRTCLVCGAAFVGAVAAGAAIAAVQVLPNAEYIRTSAMLTQRAASAEAGHRAPILSLGNLKYARHELLSYLLPNTWGNPSLHSHWWNKSSNYNESAGYIGIGTLFLSLFAWRYFARSPVIRTLCLLQLLSLGFILRVPLVTNTLGKLPLFELAANKRLLLVYCFAGAAMGALALEHLLRTRKLSVPEIIWLAFIALLFVSVAANDYLKRFAKNPYDWIPGYGRRQLLHFLLFLAPWFTIAAFPALKERLRTVLCAGLVCLAAADLFLIQFGYNPFADPGSLYPDTPVTRLLQAKPSPTRVLPMPATIERNILTVYAIQDPRLYDAVTYAPYADFLARLRTSGRDPDLRLCSIAGIRYLWVYPAWTPPASGEVDLTLADEQGPLYENNGALPHAYVSRWWRTAASPGEALDMLAQDDFPWQSTVVIEPGKARDIEPAEQEEPVPVAAATITQYGPHSVTVELPDAARGLLVLNDCYYPGWQAWVNGETRPIYRVNGTFRGLFVGPADNEVVFKYNPRSFRYGAILSIAAVAALVALMLPARRSPQA